MSNANGHNYVYYPGCSQEHAGLPYDISARAVMQELGYPLKELDDWNCCGATAYFSIKELQSFALSARNLALAEKEGATDIITACNACFEVLEKTAVYLDEKANLKTQVNDALNEVGLHYYGKVKVRHLLDVVVSDLGLDMVKSKVKKPLSNLKVAPYYGCLFSRPFGLVDHVENPTKLDELIKAVGAKPIDYEAKTRCCGGLLLQSREDVAVRLMDGIITEAVRKGADVIITACPLCHVNLELALEKVEAKHGEKYNISILFFTQLMGAAMGLSPQSLAMDKMLYWQGECRNLMAA